MNRTRAADDFNVQSSCARGFSLIKASRRDGGGALPVCATAVEIESKSADASSRANGP